MKNFENSPESHHTSQFNCVTAGTASLVLRRGQKFAFTAGFAKDFDLGKHALDLLFEYGKNAVITDTSHQSSVQKILELEAPKPEKEFLEALPAEQPSFTQPLQDVTDLTEGEFVHLECQLMPIGDPTMTTEWFVNGVALGQGSRFQTSRDFGYIALNIHPVYAEDSGTYAVVARSKHGEAMTQCNLVCKGKQSMYLDAQHPASLQKIQQLEAPKPAAPIQPDAPKQKPEFQNQLESLSDLKEGQTAHLECQIWPTSDPNLVVEWLHNGKPPTTGHRFRTTHDFGYVALDILYIYPEDSGTYTLRLTNSEGTAENTCTLSVASKRKIETDPSHPESWKKIKQMESVQPAAPSDVEVPKVQPRFVQELQGQGEYKEGQSVHFECHVEPVNDPKLKIEWFFNGVPLKQDKKLKVGKKSFVTVEVTNPIQVQLTNCRFMIEAPPFFNGMQEAAQKSVAPHGAARLSFEVHPTSLGAYGIVAKLSSSQLRDIEGFKTVQIKK